MKSVIITIAGVSSRFNMGIPEQEKVLKAIYWEDNPEDTLLRHLLMKCTFADRIILVGGYQFDKLKQFVDRNLREEFPNTVLIKNEHYEDLASGYSLYLGIKEAVKAGSSEILFAEGDLDIDRESFVSAAGSKKSVLTYTKEPIYASRAVVLYQDQAGRYKYAFNCDHGMLTINEPFLAVFNSGQVWKFMDIDALKEANDAFFLEEKGGTNLKIIQRYMEAADPREMELLCLERWTNCNTRDDYKTIRSYWMEEK